MNTSPSSTRLTEAAEGVFLAFDVGGNDVKPGVCDRSGHPLALREDIIKLPSRVKEGPNATLEQLRQAYDLLTSGSDAQVLGIGLATAGPATADGTIIKSTNYGPQWNNFNVRQFVEESFGLRTVYENDANAAALAEYRHLSGTKTSFSGVAGVLVTVGTGLGGGIIRSGGVLERGAFGMSAEIGHVGIRRAESSVDLFRDDIRCGCTRHECAEQYTTLSFLARELAVLLSQNPTHLLAQEKDVYQAAKSVLTLAGSGDAMCHALLMTQARNLGRVLADQINIHDPGWVLIGGGITEGRESIRHAYLHAVIEQIKRENPSDNLDRYIGFAALGDNAGWVGAGISAAEQIA